MTTHLNKNDTSLWLHNKLGNVNDLWSGGSICSQLNGDVLKNIRDCFPDLQSLVKLKLLCSFLHLPRKNVELWKSELDEIIELATIDTDQWVTMIAELLKSFPETGNINFDIDENATVFSDLIGELKKSAKKPSDPGILPIESLYLNTNAFIAQIGAKPHQPIKHFTLRRKPKSAALRAELLHKSNEVATSSKKNTTTPVAAARYRGSKELNDNTPLKGIPSRTSFGTSSTSSSQSTFKTPNPANRSAGSVRNPTRPTIPGVRRDGGIKLLDIGEQPLGRDAKRKKRNQEEQEAKQKENDKTNGQQDSTATPDYALGLTSMVPPSPAPAYSVPPTPGPYLGETSATSTSTSTSTSTPTTPTTPITPTTPTLSSTITKTKEIKEEPKPSSSSSSPTKIKSEVETTASIPMNETIIPSTSTSSSSSSLSTPSTIVPNPQVSPTKTQSNSVQITIVPNRTLGQQSTTIVQSANQPVIQQVQRSVIQQSTTSITPVASATPMVSTTPTSGLTQTQTLTPAPSTTNTTAPRLQLSQRQIMEAQELFKNSNSVGKVEKALILSFMGGSRENPCPHLGDIVTIKLSEKAEQLRQPDGTIINVIAENHYQMNYSSGEAKQIKRLRRAQV